ncbi:odorant receptor 85c-like isoform X2 [Orussus abietinus]|uniref:odorant receptor 85c-like isoform X2 n=1 Tax=Orussus abietinus TaxID=222816 RepID=UPI0006261D47|nr:odorant receptor 85c-like isoform X2 [Orussus abietinus]
MLPRGKDTSAISFRGQFARTATLLRLIGFFSIDEVSLGIPKGPSNLETVYFVTLIGMDGFVMSCQLVTVYREWNGNRQTAFEVGCGTLIGTFAMTKSICLLWRRVEVLDFLYRLSVTWEKYIDKLKEKAIRSFRKANTILPFYVTGTGCTIAIFIILPYLDILKQYLYTKNENNSYNFTETISLATYPFPTENRVSYFLILFWEQFLCISFAIHWLASDFLFVQGVTQIILHLKVLCDDLRNLAEGNESEHSVLKKLKNIGKRHNELLEYCGRMQEIFSLILFITMLVLSILWCFYMFRLQQTLTNGEYVISFKYVSLLVTLFLQITIYCSYSNDLTDQTLLISRAIYECRWTTRSREFKSILQIMLLRSQKPFQLTACNFFPITLDQLTTVNRRNDSISSSCTFHRNNVSLQVFKTAVSYFTLLQTFSD